MFENSWQNILRNNIRDWNVLADFLLLDENQRKHLLKEPDFALNIPLRLAEKIGKKTLEDPILKQFLATTDEKIITAGFCEDPVKDSTFRCQSRLLHKYHGRVLIVCTSACAMHCRYCFRQNFDYAVSDKSFHDELLIIQNDSSIEEVILSGGDPLSLSDRTLDLLLKGICAIPHIKRIRFHSRFLIGIPERINESFLQVLSKVSKQLIFVIHVNHAREIDDDVFIALSELRKTGAILLNQSVLLRGVNDDVNVLRDLCLSLVNNGILPYYLHQLDKVQGAAHFEVSEEKGIFLINQLMALLPGFAVPRYARENAGESSKTLINFC